jgi:HSP20 family protein
MPITKSDPIREIERFFDEEDMFGFFPAVKRHFGPAMDVYETDNDLVVELQAPKVDPGKINIAVKEGVLKIEGGEEQESEESGKTFHRKEIRKGHFVRMLSLPVNVKEDQAEATYENGVLKITIPKDVKPAKKIEVKVK